MIPRILPQCHAPLLLVLALSSFTARAAGDTPPEKPVGLSGASDPVGSVDFAPHELPGAISDYELRARLIAIAPGGATQPHPHKGRPGIVRVTKGTLIEYRGDSRRTVHAGDAWYENADTVHWFRNPSDSEAAEIWAVDIVPKKK
ncbi:MAG: cupin domain-containing protein [Rhodocyclaceae bacterium]|nr:cupin domain-containing protein [Rhodocyclaceae bacterium]MBX3667210.1 cupin domain-containing protein [Rhodocyclaceae bacterium]